MGEGLHTGDLCFESDFALQLPFLLRVPESTAESSKLSFLGSTPSRSTMYNFSPPSIDRNFFYWIIKNIPQGSTILELGSGAGTIELKKHFEVISIEHNENYLTIPDHHYIYAPLKKYKPIKRYPNNNLWYDPKAVKEGLDGVEYHAILVDGPPGKTRIGLRKFFHLFDSSVIWMFDDANRQIVWRLMHFISGKANRPYTVYDNSNKKSFGVIENVW